MAYCVEMMPGLSRGQVLLLARRREAAGPPATQQPALALEAESVESSSTQVGRKTAEQFALADGDAAKVTGTTLCLCWASARPDQKQPREHTVH